jgi:hypothetical protein
MKLVVLMYLEEDAPNVQKLMAAHEVTAYSELPVTGRGAGTTGWYGTVAPFKSRMLIAFVPAAKADELTTAISACTGCMDPNRPIRAWQMEVEKSVTSARPNPSSES